MVTGEFKARLSSVFDLDFSCALTQELDKKIYQKVLYCWNCTRAML